jgi:hypothetical protein
MFFVNWLADFRKQSCDNLHMIAQGIIPRGRRQILPKTNDVSQTAHLGIWPSPVSSNLPLNWERICARRPMINEIRPNLKEIVLTLRNHELV